MANCNVRDLTRRNKFAEKRQALAKREMDAANKRIAAIGKRAARGRPSAHGGRGWVEASYKDRPTSPALMRAYQAAMKRSQAAQSAYWRASDEVRDTGAMLKFCRGSGLGRTRKTRRR